MIAFATFDSEILDILQVTVDHACCAVPPERRTPHIRDCVAKAVLRAAAQGVRNRDRLDSVAVAAVFAEPVDAYDIEARQGDETVVSLRSVELPQLSAAWGHIAALAEKVSSPDCRIRVIDQAGKTVISVGIATARLLQST